MLAQAHLNCFTAEGDVAVWARLATVMGEPDSTFGVHVTRLAQRLEIPQESEAETSLVHVIPFLRLVGCPQQALPALGQQLRGSLPITRRFKALITAQWGPQAEDLLRGWLRESRPMPAFLSAAEAELVRREPEARREDQGFEWMVFLLKNGQHQLSLVPGVELAPGTWTGRAETAVTADQARTFGIPQDPGKDGLIQGPGVHQEVPWPRLPSFWSERHPVPRGLGIQKVFTRSHGQQSGLTCLPPGWSLDGDPEPKWRWVVTRGRPSLFDPEGNPWQTKEENAAFDVLDSIALQGFPNLKVLHRLPLDLTNLEISPGRLGSTLPAGSTWRVRQYALPPLGHLLLSWTTQKGNHREREVYCLPTIQLTRTSGEHPIVWIRGIEGLLGRDQNNQWYELSVEQRGNAWSSVVEFRGWGTGPIGLRLEGPLDQWGASLFGWRQHHQWSPRAPWNVSPRFLLEAYEENLRIEFALPREVEGRVWLDGIEPLWAEKNISNQRRMGPLEFQDPLRPLWDLVEPMGRPVRLSLAWPNPADPNDDKLKSIPLIRFFPRDAVLGVRAQGEWTLEVRPHLLAGETFHPEDWVVHVRSTSMPSPPAFWHITSLASDPLPNGHLLHLPAQAPGQGPYHIGLRQAGGRRHPISIHVDGRGNPLPRAVEAHCQAVRKRWIGGVEIRDDLADHRDQMLAYAYALAGTDLLKLLEPEEIRHWLGYLDDDFVFSQPWTLGIVLRHPELALAHLAEAPWDVSTRAQVLGNLGQCGWSWWLVPPGLLSRLEPGTATILNESLALLARRRINSLNAVTNPAARSTAVARLCEEGLFLALEPKVRQLYLKQLGFPSEMLEHPWRPRDLAYRLCQQQEDFIGGLIRQLLQPGPERAPQLPRPPVIGLFDLPPALAPLVALSGWGRAYRQWAGTAQASLVVAGHWAEATPTLFRSYGPLFTFFALLNWQD